MSREDVRWRQRFGNDRRALERFQALERRLAAIGADEP